MKILEDPLEGPFLDDLATLCDIVIGPIGACDKVL